MTMIDDHFLLHLQKEPKDVRQNITSPLYIFGITKIQIKGEFWRLYNK